MVLLAVLIFVLLIILALLVSPITLYIDTDSDLYYVNVFGIVKARVQESKEDLLLIRLSILNFGFKFYPLKQLWQKKEKRKKKKRRSRSSITFRQGMRMLKSFQVKRFDLDIDTEDCITNAKLYPLFALVNHTIADVKINFEGRNYLGLHIQNTPLRIIRSYINK